MDVIVRVKEFEIPELSTMSQESVVEELKSHAERTQAPVIDYVESTDGLTVRNEYWLTNALLVRVDTATANASELAEKPGVTGLHENFEVRALSAAGSASEPMPTASTPTLSTRANVTYGLDQLDVPEVWSKHGTRGAAAKVAVLDTGVDVGHPDIELYTEQPGNGTYPGGWAEFDTNGDRVQGATPHATSDHGTHVTGTVAGGDDSGTAIGVAPDASVMHGLVLPDGTGSFAQIIGGMQWAVEEDADVISMSLGADGFYSALVEPIRNANDAGTVVIAAAGNHGPETAPSPGSIYDSFTVGASNSDRNIAPYSGGDTVRTERDWGDAARSDWPSEYIVPDVAAPGTDVYSTLPGGEYGELSGTSMATPHVAGVAALMVSASGGDATPEQIESALATTATKPGDAPATTDIRYGNGIVDALAATTAVAAEQGIAGTVTTEAGTPLTDATVELANGAETTTNASGGYLVRTLPGTYDATASAFGYTSDTAKVTVESDSIATQDIDLDPTLARDITNLQTREVKSGEKATVTYRLAHAETLTVTQTGQYDGNVTLLVDGVERSLGESIPMDGSSETTVRVRAETTGDAAGSLTLRHTVGGLNESLTFTTGPTTVVGDPTYVGVVDSTGSEYAEQIATAVNENVPSEYFVSIVSPQEALSNTDQYDVLAIHQIGSTIDLSSFVEKTREPGTGVVYLDQWGAASNGVTALSKATQNPVVTGQDTKTDTPSYDIVANHPIFEGVAAPSDSITLHDQPRGDIAWFDRYVGTTLAMASDGDDRLGTGIAVDESTQTVLLSSLGRTSTVRNTHVTADANALLGNAIEYVNSRPPAWFQSTQPTHLTPGESFTVNVSADTLNRLNVSLTDSTTLRERDLSLSVAGAERSFGDWYAVNESTDSVAVTVDTASDVVGSVGLSIAAEGDGDTVELLSGRTAVYAKPLVVPDDVGTIQQAMDLVPPGQTVEVANGTYTGPIEVTTPGVTVTARGDERPTIRATMSGFYEPVVHVDAPNVTVEHLDVVADGFAPDGIAVERANATVRHVSVTGASHGILVGGAGSTADGAVVHDATVSDGVDLLAIGVTVGEADDAHVYNATIAGQDSGVDVYTSSETVVENTTVTDSGVGLTSFETDRLRYVNNEIHDMDESASNTVGIQLEGFVTNATVADNEIRNLSEGIYVDGTNTGGEIHRNDIDAEYGVWVENGDPPAIEIQHNDLAGTAVPLGSDLDTSLRATTNYLGERGGNESFVAGDVIYEPFLTAPPETVDTTNPHRIGVDLTLDAGSIYGLSVPGPTNQTVSDLLDDGFEGVVYGFNATTQSWTQLTGDDRVAPLQGLAVVAESDGRVTISHHVGTDEPNAPAQRTLTEGWNFVGAPEYGDVESAFAVDSLDPSLATAPFAPPASQPGESGRFDGLYRFDGPNGTAPHASAYEGYFVFVDESGPLPSYVVPNPSVTDLYEGIGRYPTNASSSLAAPGPETVSVASVVSRANETNRSAVRTTLSQVVYRTLADAVRGETASRAVLNETASEIVANAPAEHESLVADAVARARSRIADPGTPAIRNGTSAATARNRTANRPSATPSSG